MTKIEQLEATINQAQKELQELKAEQTKKINYWQPKGFDYFWFVDYTGDVVQTQTINYGNIKSYRVFKTQQEAEKYAEYIKAEETLREAIAIANEGWLPNWDARNQHKFYITLYRKKMYIEHCTETKYFPNFMYIKSQELAKKLIKEYEQEFMTYLSY